MLVTDYKLPPSLVIVEIIRDLLERIKELQLLTSPYYNVTKFVLNSMTFDLISHGSAIELRFSKKVIDEAKSEFCTLVDAFVQIKERSYESKEAYHRLADPIPTQPDGCKETCAKNQWMCREVCFTSTIKNCM